MISKEGNLLAILGKFLSLPFPAKQQGLLQKNMYFFVCPIEISMWQLQGCHNKCVDLKPLN